MMTDFVNIPVTPAARVDADSRVAQRGATERRITTVARVADGTASDDRTRATRARETAERDSGFRTIVRDCNTEHQ